jgi:hypothetical protein
MKIAMVTERLKANRRTKLYDLFAAAPLIAWYLFCAAQMLPSLADQVALVKLFVRTDPSVLPATLVLSTVSHVMLVFLVVLVVMFMVRHTPQRAALGLYRQWVVSLIGLRIFAQRLGNLQSFGDGQSQLA